MTDFRVIEGGRPQALTMADILARHRLEGDMRKIARRINVMTRDEALEIIAAIAPFVEAHNGQR